MSLKTKTKTKTKALRCFTLSNLFILLSVGCAQSVVVTESITSESIAPVATITEDSPSYFNEDIGVRANFSNNWSISTSYDEAPDVLKPNFRENKGPNESPLFIAMHDNQQLFSRLLVEPFFGNLANYTALLSQNIIAQGIQIQSAKFSTDNTSVELEYLHPQLGLMFKERIAVLEEGRVIRMALWTSRVVYDGFLPQINTLFNSVELRNVVEGKSGWQQQWAQLENRLQTDNISGINIVQADTSLAGPLVCEDPTSSMLWKVESSDNSVEVYLLGSIHVGKPEFYPFNQVVETAFHNADHLVFEVDPQSAADPSIVQSIQSRGTFPQGQTLSDVVSEATIDNLRQILRNMNIPADSFMAMKPWFLTLVLSSLQINALGYSPQFGVEAYLLNNKETTTDILELESIQEQLGFLEEMNTESYLNYTLKSFDDGAEILEEMALAWQCADKETLTDMLFNDFDTINNPTAEEIAELEQLKEMLFFERNITMADGVEDFLENGEGKYFVVVGSGHLLGEKSVVDLLREAGYGVNAVSLPQ